MSDTVVEIEKYLRQLAPHQKEREAAQLLVAAKNELSAMQQRAEVAEKLHADEQEMRIAEEKLRRAAEARIKASQEQEPDFVDFEHYGFASDRDRCESWTKQRDWRVQELVSMFGENWKSLDTIRNVVFHHYAAPVIPPDVAELWVYENHKSEKFFDVTPYNSYARRVTIDDIVELQRENAELTRKMAEQGMIFDAVLAPRETSIAKLREHFLAEAKSKASQKPVCEVEKYDGYLSATFAYAYSDKLASGTKLYAAPVIPPDVAELQRKYDELKAYSKQAVADGLDYKSERDTAQSENAKLTRKLAMQQARLKQIYTLLRNEVSVALYYGMANINNANPESGSKLDETSKHLERVGDLVDEVLKHPTNEEELTKLLAEAKSKAVPEWMPINTAPKDGTLILACGIAPPPDDDGFFYTTAVWRDGKWLDSWWSDEELFPLLLWLPIWAAPQPGGSNE